MEPLNGCWDDLSQKQIDGIGPPLKGNWMPRYEMHCDDCLEEFWPTDLRLHYDRDGVSRFLCPVCLEKRKDKLRPLFEGLDITQRANDKDMVSTG